MGLKMKHFIHDRQAAEEVQSCVLFQAWCSRQAFSFSFLGLLRFILSRTHYEQFQKLS